MWHGLGRAPEGEVLGHGHHALELAHGRGAP